MNEKNSKEEDRLTKMTIVAFGTWTRVYVAILATTGRAGLEVSMFFTFWD
jgi:peroxiredoxin family protein